MNSLVADYGTSSEKSSSESDDSEANENSCGEEEQEDDDDETTDEPRAEKLPKPDFGLRGSSTNSVFTNPFAEAENAKKAILEKHVKMVTTGSKVQTINGKKICWNYRKGRCRFGHTCTFAHDSDLQTSQVDAKQPEASEASTRSYQGANDTGQPLPDDPSAVTGVASGKKKRPGLGDNVVPSKKVMKFYKQQKLKNRK